MFAKALRVVGKTVLVAGILLAMLMVASGSNQSLEHTVTMSQTLVAALFVALAGGLVGGGLILLGRRTTK